MGKKLGVVSTLVSMAAGAVAGGVVVNSSSTKKMKEVSEKADKLYQFYKVLNQWLEVRQSGKTLKEYFDRQNYKTVAIYGMKELGERLYDELKDSGIEVCYIIDKKAGSVYADVEVVPPEADLEPVDVIVVTAIFYFDEIEEMLSTKGDYSIVSLEDILYEV